MIVKIKYYVQKIKDNSTMIENVCFHLFETVFNSLLLFSFLENWRGAFKSLWKFFLALVKSKRNSLKILFIFSLFINVAKISSKILAACLYYRNFKVILNKDFLRLVPSDNPGKNSPMKKCSHR